MLYGRRVSNNALVLPMVRMRDRRRLASLTRCLFALVIATGISGLGMLQKVWSLLLPLSLRLSLRNPTSRYGSIFKFQKVRRLNVSTFSLLLTRLIITASFSRPCIPSTVPISMSLPYIGRNMDARRVTCAWYLGLPEQATTHSPKSHTHGVITAIWEGRTSEAT